MSKAVILIADHYQDLEVWYPILRLREAGWTVVTAGVEAKKKYTGKNGYPITVDTSVEELNPKEFDAVVVPGGWAPDIIRRNQTALDLVAALNSAGKIVASICHGGWVLASAKMLAGRQCTSFSAIKDDMIHAGAKWVDQEVVVDRNLITSRKPDDLPAFCKAILESAKA
ncbi:MAG: type 1 glutamine amidotransferase domain-containing protein [Bdellovibrionota bacterium]